MIKPSFHHYHKRFEQRLGFLKIITVVGKDARGGSVEILSRLKRLYEKPLSNMPSSRSIFNPEELISREDIPSWTVGFQASSLDQLISWASNLGIIAPTGRLSEWSIILERLMTHHDKALWEDENPFLLSVEEKAYFLQLLFYHDQVMPILMSYLAKETPWKSLSLNDSCLIVIRAIGDLLDVIKGIGPDEMKVRLRLHDVLERIGKQYGLKNPRLLFSKESRLQLLADLQMMKNRGVRKFLAENHTVCRFEQLTDLGLLLKENPNIPARSIKERKDIRQAWSWCITPSLCGARKFLTDHFTDVETFLLKYWMQFCSILYKPDAKHLDIFSAQLDIASYLDEALPLARRQIGPVQLHTWASLTCIRAFSANKIIEIYDVSELLMSMHRHPKLGSLIRIGGQGDLRGRTIAVANKSIYSMLKEHPLAREEYNDKK
jgi:hypothetical protein